MEDSPVISNGRQAELLARVQTLAQERHAHQRRSMQERRSAVAVAGEQCDQACSAAEATLAARHRETEAGFAAALAETQAQYEQLRNTVQAEYHGVRSAAVAERTETEAQARERERAEAFQTLSVYETVKGQPAENRDRELAKIASQWRELDALAADTVHLLQIRRMWSRGLDPAELSFPGAHPPEASADQLTAIRGEAQYACAAVRQGVERLYHQRLTRWLEEGWPVAPCLGAAAAAYGAAAALLGPTHPWAWIAGGAGGGGSAAALLLLILPRARAYGANKFHEVSQSLQTARGALQQLRKAVASQAELEARRLLETRDAEMAALGYEVKSRIDSVTAKVEQELVRAGQSYPQKLEKLREDRDAAEAALRSQRDSSLAAACAERDRAVAAAQAERDAAVDAATKSYEQQYTALSEAWRAGMAEVVRYHHRVQQACDSVCPADWRQVDLSQWRPPTAFAPGIEFGRLHLDLATIKHAVPAEPDLAPPVRTIEARGMVTLRENPSLILTAEGPGRTAAAELLQTIAVRTLTGLPAGRVRFTLFDPTGLGENFAAMMHLADYDEGLISGRIWAEPRDIDEQLARITNHMETVLQKFLRDEYATIHEYNAQAGEVAEPLQVLVIADFPHGFGESAMRRLTSIVTGGPRCGVHVLASVDRTGRLPNDFRLDALLEGSVHLDWLRQEKRFVWRRPVFEKLPLSLAPPIEPTKLVEVIRAAGAAAKGAIRVEAPFAIVAPTEAKIWSERCDEELRIPIGRAGANRLQNVRLGQGAAHHLLVAGKTGSGKSTFLHALITSGALRFSPEELEFYLVDFKKGVEFQAYAHGRLPHARVVAIESEREFGLSVLERLDAELKRRGELYRDAAVQGIADYRALRPDDCMPRVLLVVDEFQELFVEDDKLAQDAQLLLDRLVRQGRAFGVHVVLGTQTLSGAYSIARSTLGQIAVRVALQSSEADAHLILSDERNTAARYLRRPGEAIYNDQNGLLTANEPFQVVWLPDAERIQRLEGLQRLCSERRLELPPTVVFEGAAPADPEANPELALLLDSPSAIQGEPRGAARVWLGDAIAIKPPTSVTFGRHAGANLLVVGPSEPEAAGMLAAAALALGLADPGARLVILDSARPGDSAETLWRRIEKVLGDQVERYDTQQVDKAMGRVAAELARREAGADSMAPPWYLLLWNAGRFRELRRSDGGFGFSMGRDEPPTPEKQFAELLRSGPSVGLHTLAWCDGYNTLTRLVDRVALREFGQRVVMQMSAADSSNLLDSPAASKLRAFRALFYSDETGQIEKFRPYAMPSDAWLERIAKRGAARLGVAGPAPYS